MKPLYSADDLPPSGSDGADALPALLRDRPRRVPLTAPPDAYFEDLPLRLLNRIREVERPAYVPAAEPLRLPWARLRLALASATLGGAFVVALLVGRPGGGPTAGAPAEATLTNVSPTEMVDYLADPMTSRLTSTDLSDLSMTDDDATPLMLNVPDTELREALDELSPTDGLNSEEFYL